jgi:hypothetical protein
LPPVLLLIRSAFGYKEELPMSDEDKSLDLTGMGKLAKAIPASSWNKLVKTACDTFTQLLAPITAATTGLGRLIQAKFDGMVDAQKVLAADAVKKATKKVANTGRKPKGNPKSLILIKAIDNASISFGSDSPQLAAEQGPGLAFISAILFSWHLINLFL